MTNPATTNESAMRGRLDSLVCGELAEQERGQLLAWLEADTSRWRDCALAFLEAQAWEETLEPRAAGQQDRPIEQVGGSSHAPTKERHSGRQHCGGRHSGGRQWLYPLAAVAASVAAFACGVWWQGSRPGLDSPGEIVHRDQEGPPAVNLAGASGPLLASVPVKGGVLGNVEAVLQLPVQTPEESRTTAASAISDRVRREWERRGYKLTEERRYLPARLPDGRQVMVPVNEVKMKFVGRPVS